MIKKELFIPIYANPFNNRIKKALKGFLKGLLTDLDIEEISINRLSHDRRFVEIMIKGRDESIAYRFLQHEIGVKRKEIKENEEIIGRVFDLASDAILVDVGLEEFKLYEISPEHFLSCILERNVTKIIEPEFLASLFGLKKYFPLFIKRKNVSELTLTKRSIEFFKWVIKSPFDLIIAYGVTRNSLENFIRKKGFRKFIRTVQRISFLEQLIIMQENQRTSYVERILSENFPKASFAKIIKKRLRHHLKLLFV